MKLLSKKLGAGSFFADVYKTKNRTKFKRLHLQRNISKTFDFVKTLNFLLITIKKGIYLLRNTHFFIQGHNIIVLPIIESTSHVQSTN